MERIPTIPFPRATLSSSSSYVSSRPEKYTCRDAQRRRLTPISLTRTCVRLLRRHRSWKERTEETILLNCQINVRKTQTRDPVRFRSRSSFFVVSFYYLFFPPPFSRGRWRRGRMSGRYLTTTDVNSFTRAQNRFLYS